jgi:hypothetical protein
MMTTAKKFPGYDPAKIAESDRQERDLRDDLESLCRAVALLDDAGLPLEHKRLIATAKKLRKRLA